MPRYNKLVFISENNNNKFYIMEEKNGQLHIEYGRIDHTSTKLTKSMGEWESILRSKIKKGYKDVTDLVTEKVIDTPDSNDITVLSKLDEVKVNTFLDLMQKYTNGLVTNTYSVTYKNVTIKQIKTAQSILDELGKIDKTNEKLVNEKLIELYTIIPRKMGKVSQHLLPLLVLDKALEKEQDNIDAMSSQVEMYEQEKKNSKDKPKDKVKKQTILDVLGIENMTEVKSNSDLKYLIDQVGGRNKIEGIFELNKQSDDSIFDTWLNKQKDKTTKTLIHGTRCSSVLSILKQGLKIRPAGNFQFSGKAYGDALYFSEVVSKSLGYTGYDNDKVLLVYEVHVGNPFIYNGWYRGSSFVLNYKNLQERGYDSTYVKPGNGLLNSEIVIYTEQQNRLKYIIWLK